MNHYQKMMANRVDRVDPKVKAANKRLRRSMRPKTIKQKPIMTIDELCQLTGGIWR